MADNILKLGAEFDASAIKSGAETSKQAVGGIKTAFELLGVTINDSISEWLATLPGVGAVFEAAFPVVGAIALFDILEKVGEKVTELISSTFIYTEEQKRLDQETRDATQVAAAHLGVLDQLNKTYEKMGKLQSQQTGQDIAQLELELDLAKNKRESEWLALNYGDDDAESLRHRRAEYERAVQLVETLEAKLKNLRKEQELQGQAEGLPMAEAAIDAQVKAGEAKIAAAKATFAQVKALVKISIEQTEAAETDFETRLYNIKRDGLQRRLQLLQLDPDKNQAQITALQGQIQALAFEHEAALTNIKTQGIEARKKRDEAASNALAANIIKTLNEEKKANDEQIKDNNARLDGLYDQEIEKAKGAEQQKEQLIEQSFLRGKITQKQEIEAIAQAKAEEIQTEINYLRAKEVLWAGDEQKIGQIERQITKLIEQQSTIRAKAVTEGIKAEQRQWQSVISGMQSAFSSFTQGLLSGHETIAQSWANLVNGMVARFIEGLERQLMQFIANAVIQETVEEAQSKKSALRNAIDAAGKAYKWAANWGGPPAGAIAAAVAFAGVEAFGSAEGGQWEVPGIQPTILHPQEMVLPASIASRMRDMVEGGGTMSSRSALVFAPTIHALDAQGVDRVLTRHQRIFENRVDKVLKKRGLFPK